MANYPSYPIGEGSHEITIDEALVTRARDGSPRVRRVQAAESRAFQVNHYYLTGAQKNTLKTFWTDNRKLTFSFTWLDNVAYTVVFGDSQVKYEPQGADRWNVTLQLLKA